MQIHSQIQIQNEIQIQIQIELQLAIENKLLAGGINQAELMTDTAAADRDKARDTTGYRDTDTDTYRYISMTTQTVANLMRSLLSD